VAVSDKLVGAAKSVYNELVAKFGPDPVNYAEAIIAAVNSFARKLGYTNQSEIDQVANMVLALGITESGLRQVAANAPGEQSYGIFQLNLAGKGAGYTKEELLGDAIGNIVIAADYLVRAAFGGPMPTNANRIPFNANAAARRMIFEQAPKGTQTIKTGVPQGNETAADAAHVQGVIDYMTQQAANPVGSVGPYSGQSGTFSPNGVDATGQISWPKLSDYNIVSSYDDVGNPVLAPDYISYNQAIEAAVAPYAGAGVPLPVGAPAIAQTAYDAIMKKSQAGGVTEDSTNLANYVDAIVTSLGADIEARRLTSEQATAEFNRRLDAANFGVSAFSAVMPYTIPPGSEYIPGFEPDSVAVRELGMKPVEATPWEYNPFEMAERLVTGTPSPMTAGTPTGTSAGEIFNLALGLVQGGGAAGPSLSQPAATLPPSTTPSTTPAAPPAPGASAPSVQGPVSAQPGGAPFPGRQGPVSTQPPGGVFPGQPPVAVPGPRAGPVATATPTPTPRATAAVPTGYNPNSGWQFINGQWKYVGTAFSRPVL